MRILQAFVSVVAPQLKSLRSLFLVDAHVNRSTWSAKQGVCLAGSAFDWNTYKTMFGEVSLLRAIALAGSAGTSMAYAEAWAVTDWHIDAESGDDTNRGGIRLICRYEPALSFIAVLGLMPYGPIPSLYTSDVAE